MKKLGEFEVGDIVIVKQDLTTTKNRYNLDSNGHMLRMRGHEFKITDLDESSNGKYAVLRCIEYDYFYHFDLTDIKKIKDFEEDEKLLILKNEKPEFFDPQNLVRR